MAEASVPTPVAEELTSPEATNPNIGLPDFGESEDTAVNAAPADLLRDAVRPDDWDGPTTEAALTEMAALAAASAEAGGEAGAEVAVAGGGGARPPRERAGEPAVRQRSAAAGERSEAPGGRARRREADARRSRRCAPAASRKGAASR